MRFFKSLFKRSAPEANSKDTTGFVSTSEAQKVMCLFSLDSVREIIEAQANDELSGVFVVSLSDADIVGYLGEPVVRVSGYIHAATNTGETVQ